MNSDPPTQMGQLFDSRLALLKGGEVPEEESDTELEALSQHKHLSKILLNLTSENTKAEGPKSSYTGKHMALERRS